MTCLNLPTESTPGTTHGRSHRRTLSQVAQQSIDGAPGSGSGGAASGGSLGSFGPSQHYGDPGGNSLSQDLSDLATVAKAYLSAGGITLDFGGESPIPIPGLGSLGILSSIASMFESGDSHDLPRQMQKGRHPIYVKQIGLSEGLVPTQKSPVYATVEDAVRAAAPLANSVSSKTGNETGGAIVVSGKGYTYTAPQDLHDPCGHTGDTRGAGYLYLPPGSVASYHTHPSTCKDGVPSEVSQEDFDFALGSNLALYYIEPNGQIHELTPGGVVRPLEK